MVQLESSFSEVQLKADIGQNKGLLDEVFSKALTQVSEATSKAEETYIKTQTKISKEEVVASISDKEINKLIVKYFLEKKHWFTGRHYWVSFQKVLTDNRNSNLSAYSRDEIQIALNELVDLSILTIQSRSSPAKFGLNHGPELEQFKNTAYE